MTSWLAARRASWWSVPSRRRWISRFSRRSVIALGRRRLSCAQLSAAYTVSGCSRPSRASASLKRHGPRPWDSVPLIALAQMARLLAKMMSSCGASPSCRRSVALSSCSAASG